MFLQLMVCFQIVGLGSGSFSWRKGKTEVIEAPSGIKYYTLYVLNHFKFVTFDE